MTFPARLTELLEKATKEPSIRNQDSLDTYLAGHAEAIRDLVVAAEKAQEAMMVWTNTYAPEMCDPEGVKKSQELLNEGGTLYYIATVSQSLSEALAKLEEA